MTTTATHHPAFDALADMASDILEIDALAAHPQLKEALEAAFVLGAIAENDRIVDRLTELARCDRDTISEMVGEAG